MAVDPFSLKQMSRTNPSRILMTAGFRAADQAAKIAFPFVGTWKKDIASPVEGYTQADTAVVPEQMGALLEALSASEESGGAIVEIGSYRGVTTRELATRTRRPIFAIDPFMGYGGAEADLELFKSRVADQPHVTHLRKTSGAAAQNWPHGPISFVFIDAVHDYANTWFDAQTWGRRVQPGGFIAFHDIDSRRYAGTHCAAARFGRGHDVFRRVEGLVIFRKPG